MRTGAHICARSTMAGKIFLDGERIGKVVEHPAFREAARNMAKLFDIAAAPDMSERDDISPRPKTGAPVWRGYQIPRSHGRPQGPAPVLGDLGGSELRADGAHTRPCRRVFHRICRRAQAYSRRRPAVRR